MSVIQIQRSERNAWHRDGLPNLQPIEIVKTNLVLTR
jgi:hypothetical protein